MDNYISAFSKGVFRCCRQLVIVYMFIAQYLSVKCAVLMHLSFTCITRMIDFGVVCLSILVSNIKCDGSWVISDGLWVTYQMGQWVVDQFQWPIACSDSVHRNAEICELFRDHSATKTLSFQSFLYFCPFCKRRVHFCFLSPLVLCL